MKTGERIVELLEKIVNISAETSNQQLEIIDKLNMIRINTMNTAKNTNNHTLQRETKTYSLKNY